MNTIASDAGVLVVKYGGSALRGDGFDPFFAEIAGLSRRRPIVVVHGGGRDIDRALARRRIATSRHDGLRVTGAAALEVTEAALCATVNKRLVRAFLAAGALAVGVSGQDGAMLIAQKLPASRDLGFVGSVVRSDPRLLHALLDGGFVPVVAPLAVSQDAAHAFNVNADSAAAAVAVAMQATAFVVLTDVPRIRRDPQDAASAIDRLSLEEAIAFSRDSACRDGMRPKIDAAIAYASAGYGAAYVCASAPNAIDSALRGDATVIER